MRFLLVCLTFLSVFQLLGQPIYRKGPLFETFPTDSAFTSNFRFHRDSTGGNFQYIFNPHFRAETNLSGQSVEPLLEHYAGLSFQKEKWYADARVEIRNSANPEFYLLNPYAGNYGRQQALQPAFFLSFRPNRIFTLSGGFDESFIGEGYRSLFLGDAGSKYPFLRANAQFWKINYSIQYSYLNNSGVDDPSDKFTATHVLTFSPWKWLDLQLFESIVWLKQDSGMDRGFDLNYLNPIIFFRPVEFGIGSSDNALVGFGANIHPSEKVTLYSQLLLDEFLLKEIRANRGWWANKWGVQAGFKVFDLFGIEGFSILGEANAVRPFTYGHITGNTAYAHHGMSLAHPTGSNFMELLALAQLKRGRNRFTITANAIRSGFGEGWGADVNESYALRNQEYGNSFAQGNRYNIYTARLNYGYMIWPKHGLELIGELRSFTYRSQTRDRNDVYGSVGIRTPVFNTYQDY